MTEPTDIPRTEEEWRKRLSPEEFRVLRKKGTEPAFSGTNLHVNEDGRFACRGCGTVLFSSGAKYDSGTGWPSFYQARSEDRIKLRQDLSHGMDRTEVMCAACGGHLGHLFDDGPAPTGKRYCINSVALDFIQEDK